MRFSRSYDDFLTSLSGDVASPLSWVSVRPSSAMELVMVSNSRSKADDPLLARSAASVSSARLMRCRASSSMWPRT